MALGKALLAASEKGQAEAVETLLIFNRGLFADRIKASEVSDSILQSAKLSHARVLTLLLNEVNDGYRFDGIVSQYKVEDALLASSKTSGGTHCLSALCQFVPYGNLKRLIRQIIRSFEPAEYENEYQTARREYTKPIVLGVLLKMVSVIDASNHDLIDELLSQLPDLNSRIADKHYTPVEDYILERHWEVASRVIDRDYYEIDRALSSQILCTTVESLMDLPEDHNLEQFERIFNRLWSKGSAVHERFIQDLPYQLLIILASSEARFKALESTWQKVVQAAQAMDQAQGNTNLVKCLKDKVENCKAGPGQCMENNFAPLEAVLTPASVAGPAPKDAT